MMMRRLIVFLILAGMASGSLRSAAAGKNADRISGESKILEEEWALARKSEFYFLFNLKKKTIELKCRGLVLRTWTAQRIRFWGKPVSFGTRQLLRKTALTEPQRRIIKPGEDTAPASQPQAKTGTFELEALEVKDMPQKYTLELEGGTDILVTPRKKGALGIWDVLKWHLGVSVKTTFRFFKSQNISLIQMAFDDPKEGQSMYWTLTEGLKGLIWFPQSD